MNKGIEIARGKTKILYENPGQPHQLVVEQTDQISSGDGARRNVIAGKGRLAAQTTARVFRLLNLCGLPAHYLTGGEDDDNNEMVVRRANMIPLEVVTRGVAAGSFVKRNPGLPRGTLLVPRVVEFFFKDDANHDPLIAPDQIITRGIATPQEVGIMSE
ncbi:MAG: phosphoribosylaminoimidazolesuccinocarboxamide synthase, partial [Candidatus Cybelea sp.]